MSKITRAFATITSALSRGPSKPAAGSGKASTLRPTAHAVLQDLGARKGAQAAGVASAASAGGRPRIAAGELSRAMASGTRRSPAAVAARIKALPSPALPLDVQMRFDALKARTPKAGNGGNALKRQPEQGLPDDLQARFDALKAATPKPASGSGRGSLKREPAATDAKKIDSGAPQPTSIDIHTSVSVHVDADSGKQTGKASEAEPAKPIESPASSGAPSGHAAEGPTAEDPKVEGPKVEGPKADGPEADGPEAGGPGAGRPKAEAAEIEEVKTEHQDPHEELAGLAGKVNDHVNGMHQAVAAHPSEQEQLMMQEMAALNELAMLISQILARLTQRSGEALLAITRS